MQIMDADQVQVGQAMAARCLTPQRVNGDRVRLQFGRQELERDRFVKPLVLRPPDFAHTAAPQKAHQRVTSPAQLCPGLQGGTARTRLAG
jgi:hypothetical protein